jgi:hypothetical protein
MPNLDMVQGFLVAKDADPNLPLAQRAQTAVPGVTYASMHVGVAAAPENCSASSSNPLSKLTDSSSSSSSSKKKSTSK